MTQYEAILEVLADGEWHPGWEIAERCAQIVPPESGYRYAKVCRSGSEKDVGAFIKRGQRKRIHARLWELAFAKNVIEHKGPPRQRSFRLRQPTSPHRACR